MRFELDAPLAFDRQRCEICGHEDNDWRLMHFLSDGVWRKLILGMSLRDQGIDDINEVRLYCIHACTEAVMRTFRTLDEIRMFYKSLRDGPP